MGNLYLDQLEPWYAMLNEGLTTFEEGDYDDRSDCHAWGSSPLYHFMSIVGGISSSKPGFKEIEVKPSFGTLTEIKLNVPHPDGELRMQLVKNDGEIKGSVVLPESVAGTFIMNGKKIKLTSGQNVIFIK